MSGLVSLRANVSIPAERRPFLEKVRLDGDFGIDEGDFTKADTQQSVNRLSQGARGEKHDSKDGEGEEAVENVLSNLKGHVILRNGVASFRTLVQCSRRSDPIAGNL